MIKPTVLILGKLPPPLIGPAIATDIILNSSLNKNYNLVHADTKINKEISKMGIFSLDKIFKSFSIYVQFWKQLKTSSPQLVLVPISQTSMGFLKDSVYILLAKKFGSNVVVQLRGSNWKRWQQSASFLIRMYTSFALKRTKGVIVLGDCLKSLFEGFYEENQIYVVPNGANYQIPSKLECGKSGEVKILYLANFLRSKGFKQLLESLVELNKKGVTNWQLKAAGNWYDRDYELECKKLIEKHRLNVIIDQPKWGEDKFQLYANSDIFVFTPNEPEGHPWVIVEAMAAGLPIISTNQGAISESVIHGKNGFIVETNNSASLANYLLELIDNKSERLKMGEASKQRYSMCFTEEKMVNNLNKTFELVLS